MSGTTSISANQGGLPLQPTRSAYSARSKRSISRNSSHLGRSYSTHLDDGAVYHGGDYDSGVWEGSEHDRDKFAEEEEVLDHIRDGRLDEKDLEAPSLQKKTTTRSRKDPNIVRFPLSAKWYWL